MNKVYVIGHRHPDTDSICSAIGYAELLNSKEPGKYVPARCGDINPETRFVLERFGVEAPLFIESVEPNVSDLPFTYPLSARADVPTIEVVAMMDEHGVRNMPIVDDEGRLLGLVSEHGLARAYVTRTKIQQLSITPIKLETLAKILDARIVVPGKDLLEGRVHIAIDALHVSLSRLTSSDVAIVGDNEPAQLALISAGIAALIIADGSPVGDRMINAAVARNVAVLATSLDAFGVGKMINLSLPASMVMATDVPRIAISDPLEYVKDVVSNSKYRTACVVEGDNRLLGMVSRNTFVDDIHKSVILVDHNEYSQAVDGIEKADVMEIVDHHRLGAITTLKPIRFLNDPVGSTSTIITRKFIESGVEPTPSTAGLLLSGVLSDTLALKMSTTTPEDERAVNYLAGIAGVDAGAFGIELVQQGIELENVPLHELLLRDTKHYNLFEKSVVISQVTVPSFEFSASHAGEIRANVAALREETGADFFVALFTNVFENASDLFAAADEVNLAKMGMAEQPKRLDGVMSRKKDFLPQFGNMLRRL
ncbi:CBS domain containing protein [Methanofollis liminatans DSM 4140]|jgi:manganese-dependent inorganic pyrophosphatase|uniref:inorganic diphosphatase n=1 Tax=Methanofollis liminatans DSM 4140 TaxID=28892 RepID=J1L1H0_9EURY|nr:putative manganese-dependent inorganic diphosphatase [Methanofollis liminatans]EJG06847.1 CBS domain containing protein [Methanofollis liminatans DSM 4140]